MRGSHKTRANLLPNLPRAKRNEKCKSRMYLLDLQDELYSSFHKSAINILWLEYICQFKHIVTDNCEQLNYLQPSKLKVTQRRIMAVSTKWIYRATHNATMQ